MAEQMQQAADSKAEKKQIREERKRLKQEEKAQKKAIKTRAKEIQKREAEIEAEEEKGNGVSTFFVTTVIVLVWIAILCFLIKLDVGGFGSEVLTPLLKDVPVINKILPNPPPQTETTDEGAYGGYTSLKDAVDYIKVLELELERSQNINNANTEEIAKLLAEIERLSEFEQKQVEFQRIYEQFYEQVIYADKGPGIEEYKKFYESIDPATAEALYKQVLLRLEKDKELINYIAKYSQMKPKDAAEIFDKMTDNLNLVASILTEMESDAAAKILAAMDPATAAKLTKIMYPDT